MAATVFERADAAARLLGEIASELDGDALDLEAAKRLVEITTRCERFAHAVRSAAALRVAAGINWKHARHRTPAEWLANATGVSVGQASRELETAKRLEELPATAEAYRNGELSEAQAAEIAASATVDPAAEQQLLATARDGGGYRAVRDQCREVTMRAADDAERARRLHETRSTRTYPGLNGHLVVHAELAPGIGAAVRSVLEHKTDELFRQARAAGTTELRSAYQADALAALVLGDGPRPSPDVRVHLDEAAAERGYALPGERCHLDGIGPVPVATALDLLADAKVTFLRHGSDGDITHVSSSTRTIPASLRRWLEATYPTCGRRGCHSTFHLEIDHIIPIAEGGPTDKTNLWRLCHHDHFLKHHRGWKAAQAPDGTWDLIPPDRHPPRDGPASRPSTRDAPIHDAAEEDRTLDLGPSPSAERLHLDGLDPP